MPIMGLSESITCLRSGAVFCGHGHQQFGSGELIGAAAAPAGTAHLAAAMGSSSRYGMAILADGVQPVARSNSLQSRE
jgi:hypothetical protein